VAISIVTFILTAVIVAAHFNPIGTAIFIGTKVEGTIVIVSVVLWSAIVAVNTDAGLALGPGEDGAASVQDANLYYFSWAGFVTSVVLLVSFLRDAFGVDVVGTIRGSAARVQWWAALLAASVVVLGSAAQVLKIDCGDDSESGADATYCRRTKWAISASTICMLLCLFVIATKVIKYTSSEASTSFMVELGSSFLLAITNIFVVLFTTSAGGPGRQVGNLYYFSWAMALISVFLASQCYSEYANVPTRSSHDESTPPDHRHDLELQVETFDDNI
jgi:hypothetical protein